MADEDKIDLIKSISTLTDKVNEVNRVLSEITKFLQIILGEFERKKLINY